MILGPYPHADFNHASGRNLIPFTVEKEYACITASVMKWWKNP